MRTYTALNGHNGSFYTMTVSGDYVRLETEKSDGFSFVDYLARDSAARIIRNWRADPAISVCKW